MITNGKDKMPKSEVTQFAIALGLDPTFARKVDTYGQRAIIARVRSVDQTGAHGRFLSLGCSYDLVPRIRETGLGCFLGH